MHHQRPHGETLEETQGWISERTSGKVPKDDPWVTSKKTCYRNAYNDDLLIKLLEKNSKRTPWGITKVPKKILKNSWMSSWWNGLMSLWRYSQRKSWGNSQTVRYDGGISEGTSRGILKETLREIIEET